MKINYPIKFEPILQEKIWGGTKLKDVLNKSSKSSKIGESWEISAVEGYITKVCNGSQKGKKLTQLIEEFKGDLIGDSIYAKFGSKFPLLIKFIDAQKDLSVQLHPDDEIAKKRHDSFGKTEMWYIMQADAEAKLNIGFNKTVEKQEYYEKLDHGELVDILHFENVKKGDSFLINPGKVHAIGSGVLLAEIQQTSDITYRIYDWNRVDDSGNSRELHTYLALDIIEFEKKDDYKLNYSKGLNRGNQVASNQYFTTNYLLVKGSLSRDFKNVDSFKIYMCVSGNATITINDHSENLRIGETVLIPAVTRTLEIFSEQSELLEIYIS